MIYTSYWGRAKALMKAGIEPVAICRGKPKWFNGIAEDRLAPTWPMMRMPLDEFWTSYRDMVEKLNAEEVAKSILERSGAENVALMCYERDAMECHRHVVADWMSENGIEVREWDPREKREDYLQMSMF